MNAKEVREGMISRYRPDWASEELRKMGPALHLAMVTSQIEHGTGAFIVGEFVLIYLGKDSQTHGMTLHVIDGQKGFSHQVDIDMSSIHKFILLD